MNDKRLHIATSKYCNNHCIFCLGEENKRQHRGLEEVSKLLRDNKNICKKVIFTTGEPTLNENLADFIKLAKKMGYGDIQLITNGRRLANKEYLVVLIKAGLNGFVVSIHGHNSQVHDFITTKPGSFAETFKGLLYLNKLRNKYNFKIITSTIIIKPNLNYLLKILLFLIKFNPDEIILNPVIPKGRVLRNKANILFAYSDFMKKYNKIIKFLPKNQKVKIKIIGLPACLYADANQENLGRTERMILEEDKKIVSKKATFNKIKRAECSACNFFRTCDGVWENYIKIFGWREFNPIRK